MRDSWIRVSREADSYCKRRWAKDVAEKLSSEHIQKEIVRMTNVVERDPELAIGTAKEFVESICKTILNERRKTFEADEDLPKLVLVVLDDLKPTSGLGSDKKPMNLYVRSSAI